MLNCSFCSLTYYKTRYPRPYFDKTNIGSSVRWFAKNIKLAIPKVIDNGFYETKVLYFNQGHKPYPFILWLASRIATGCSTNCARCRPVWLARYASFRPGTKFPWLAANPTSFVPMISFEGKNWSGKSCILAFKASLSFNESGPNEVRCTGKPRRHVLFSE